MTKPRSCSLALFVPIAWSGLRSWDRVALYKHSVLRKVLKKREGRVRALSVFRTKCGVPRAAHCYGKAALTFVALRSVTKHVTQGRPSVALRTSAPDFSDTGIATLKSYESTGFR